MLQEHVPSDRVFLSTGQHDWTWNSMNDLRAKTLFVGHNFLEPLYMFPDEQWVTALALRDPLDWWRSYYKYRRRPDRAGSGNSNPSLRLTFDEYIKSSPDKRLANPQSAWLLMRTRLGPVAASSTGRAVATALAPGTGNPRRTLFALLRSVTSLGTTDDLFAVYRRACDAMGWEPKFDEAKRDNASPEEGEHLTLSKRQAKRLRRLTQVDLAAYEFARERSHTPPH